MDHLWTPWRYSYVHRTDADARKGVPSALSAWPAEEDRHCVFCNLIGSTDYAIRQGMASEDADRAALIVHRGEYCFICLNAFPYASGHVLILPYEHLDSLAGLREPAAHEMMRLAQRVETIIRSVYQPDGLNFGINLGESAGAGVADHLHIHALPRWSGDTNFMSVTAETRILPEVLEITWGKLNAAFKK
jgi:ATP adenylyltransferase